MRVQELKSNVPKVHSPPFRDRNIPEVVQMVKFDDNRPEAVAQRRLKKMIDNSAIVAKFGIIQRMINSGVVKEQVTAPQSVVPIDTGHVFSQGNRKIIQRRIKKGDAEYSFLPQTDLAGNPFLATEGEAEGKGLMQISEKQDNIDLEPVASTAVEYNEDTAQTVFHNLNMGRPQHVSKDGSEAYLEPFRSYQFGPKTRPDVGVFPIAGGEAQKALFYKNFKTRIRSIVFADDGSDIEDSLEDVKRDLDHLIIAEEFRTEGAQSVFLGRWTEFMMALSAYQRARGRRIAGKRSKLSEAIRNCTTDLPFAGSGGTKKFRKQSGQEEQPQMDVYRRGASPEKNSAGGFRKGKLAKGTYVGAGGTKKTRKRRLAKGKKKGSNIMDTSEGNGSGSGSASTARVRKRPANTSDEMTGPVNRDDETS